MFGLDGVQMITLAIAALVLLVSKNPFEGAAGFLRKILGAASPEGMLEKMIENFYSCGHCTPEEEEKIEEAISILVKHFIKHRMAK